MKQSKHIVRICSFESVGDIPPRTSYKRFKAKVLRAGRYSVFEATANPRTAKLYDRLYHDPDIVLENQTFPWTTVTKKDTGESSPKRRTRKK